MIWIYHRMHTSERISNDYITQVPFLWGAIALTQATEGCIYFSHSVLTHLPNIISSLWETVLASLHADLVVWRKQVPDMMPSSLGKRKKNQSASFHWNNGTWQHLTNLAHSYGTFKLKLIKPGQKEHMACMNPRESSRLEDCSYKATAKGTAF